mgnify:CR=1 FL=1
MYITALTIGIALTAAALCQPAKPLPVPSAHIAHQAVLLGDKSTLLPADVAAILERPELRNATIGLYAINLKTGSPIIKYNSNRACMPASNQKLLTAAALNGLSREARRMREQVSVFLGGVRAA